MATGVEIAGLVLGAMPLVIYALESYRKGLAPLLDYFHYESTLTKLRTRLNIQHVLFEDHLKRLLLSQSSPAEIEALFYDPNEHTRITIWASQEVEQKLRKKLGPHQFKIFVDVLQEMDGVMKKLMVNLDIDMKGKVGNYSSFHENDDVARLQADTSIAKMGTCCILGSFYTSDAEQP